LSLANGVASTEDVAKHIFPMRTPVKSATSWPIISNALLWCSGAGRRRMLTTSTRERLCCQVVPAQCSRSWKKPHSYIQGALDTHKRCHMTFRCCTVLGACVHSLQANIAGCMCMLSPKRPIEPACSRQCHTNVHVSSVLHAFRPHAANAATLRRLLSKDGWLKDQTGRLLHLRVLSVPVRGRHHPRYLRSCTGSYPS